jgi:purine-binding chemotaxis protein CheW
MSIAALHVVFRVGAGEYVLPAADVLQLESYTGATPMPGGPAFVAGVVQVRGRVVPVVDLRARFGLPPAEATMDTRVVVAQHGERTIALLADSAREVVRLAPEQVKPPPQLVAEEADGYVRAVAQVGPRLLMLIDFERVIGEEHGHAE